MTTGTPIATGPPTGTPPGEADRQGVGRVVRAALPTALTVALSGLGLVVVFVLAVGSSFGQRVENSSLSAADPGGSRPFLLGLVSVPHLAVALLVVLAVALLRRRPRVALRVLLLVAGANVAGQALKYHVLTRPTLTDLTSVNTFPSGHIIVFTSVLAALLMALPAVLRPYAAVAGAAVLGLAGWELLQYGWHRPSDVVGGMLLVVCLAALTVLAVGRGHRRRPARPALRRVVGLLGLAAALGLVAAVAVGLRLLAGGRPVDAELLLLDGQLAVVAVACLTAAVAAWLPPE